MATILPDLAPCAACLDELNDPADRRYHYPFICCTACGPRYSVVESLPYDRQSTTMRHFTMCDECRCEYDDPGNRRYHAQANCCPACGPRVTLLDRAGCVLAVDEAAIDAAAKAIRLGQIVALKSVGGFQLLVDAANDAAVAELRGRKARPEKPLATIFPLLADPNRNSQHHRNSRYWNMQPWDSSLSRDDSASPSPDVACFDLAAECDISAIEERMLTSPAAPIVLLRRHTENLSKLLAPGSPLLGVMLPASPLHHLLLARLTTPVVATSGNLADEPICIDNDDAQRRLSPIADCFLVHDRPIAHRVDDSLVREIAGEETILRRARGYAPLPIALPVSLARRLKGRSILATGGHLKSTIALMVEGEVILSPHIGDLGSGETCRAFAETIDSFAGLYRVSPEIVAGDAHPDYHSSLYATRLSEQRLLVGHHHAHALACLADNRLEPPALAFVWDGAGYGGDDTSWGGEALLISNAGYQRLAHWRHFRLPGGDKAAVEPRRAAFGLLSEIFGQSIREWDPALITAFTDHEASVLASMLSRGINSPQSSAVGRLFDAVASLLGLHQRLSFEGQAASGLESIATTVRTEDCYHLPPPEPSPGSPPGSPLILDWEPMIRQILADLAIGTPPGLISARFHNTLAASLLLVANFAGEPQVCLSGGCFQNRYLTERALKLLRHAGFSAFHHRRVPPNDGGIALGQVMAASMLVAGINARNNFDNLDNTVPLNCDPVLTDQDNGARAC